MHTKEGLLGIFNEKGICPDRYSIYEGIKSDSVVLQKWGSLWKIFYVDERGEQHELDYASDEQDAFEKFLKAVLSDI